MHNELERPEEYIISYQIESVDFGEVSVLNIPHDEAYGRKTVGHNILIPLEELASFIREKGFIAESLIERAVLDAVQPRITDGRIVKPVADIGQAYCRINIHYPLSEEGIREILEALRTLVKAPKERSALTDPLPWPFLAGAGVVAAVVVVFVVSKVFGF